MGSKKGLYIRKRQIERMKYISWICSSVIARLENEKPKSEDGIRRVNFEKEVFYGLWDIVIDCMNENAKRRNKEKAV